METRNMAKTRQMEDAAQRMRKGCRGRGAARQAHDTDVLVGAEAPAMDRLVVGDSLVVGPNGPVATVIVVCIGSVAKGMELSLKAYNTVYRALAHRKVAEDAGAHGPSASADRVAVAPNADGATDTPTNDGDCPVAIALEKRNDSVVTTVFCFVISFVGFIICVWVQLQCA